MAVVIVLAIMKRYFDGSISISLEGTMTTFDDLRSLVLVLVLRL